MSDRVEIKVELESQSQMYKEWGISWRKEGVDYYKDCGSLSRVATGPYNKYSVFKVHDKTYLGRALGQERYFNDKVGDLNASFDSFEKAIRFIALQLGVDLQEVFIEDPVIEGEYWTYPENMVKH